MRIAVSAENDNGLESTVAQHFGRCPFYILIDIEDGEVKAVQGVKNPHFESHQPGMVPGFINDQKVNVMISGGMGKRALQFFEEFGVGTATGAAGTVEKALVAYQNDLLEIGAPCKQSEEHSH